jgi:hypothetical protein
MIAMEKAQNVKDNSERFQMLGYGLLIISDIESKGAFKIILQKGIGVPLIQNVLELYKNEIITKKQGSSIIPLNEFTIHIQYFNNNSREISVILYMEEKEPNTAVNFSQLYFLSKKIYNKILSNASLTEISKAFEDKIEIPKSSGVIAIFVIGSAGSPFLSKINKKRNNIADHEVHIGGFISALLSFSNTIIGEETGAKLKEINFGNQQFYVISKSNVIFAFLVENMNSLLQRYMYLIADEFIYDFNNYLKEFNGDVTPFASFEDKINQYFII